MGVPSLGARSDGSVRVVELRVNAFHRILRAPGRLGTESLALLAVVFGTFVKRGERGGREEREKVDDLKHDVAQSPGEAVLIFLVTSHVFWEHYRVKNGCIVLK